MNDDIIEKIKKLLALSESSNPNEAAVAYAAATKLIAKHRVDTKDLADDPIIKIALPELTAKKITSWKSHLFNVIGKLHGCLVYIDRKNFDGMFVGTIVGQKSDVEIVRYFYASISNQIEAMKNLAMATVGKGQGKTFSNNFKMEAVNVVVQRLRETQVEIKESNEQAIILVDQRLIQARAAAPPTKVNASPAVRYDPYARSLGAEAGKQVQFSKGLEKSSSSSRLLTA